MLNKHNIVENDEGNKIYVAVGKNRQQNLDMLSFILQQISAMDDNRRRQISLVFIHVILPPKFIPFPMGIIAVSQVDAPVVQVFKEKCKERLASDCFRELLDRCLEAGLTCELLVLEKLDVAKGLVEIIDEFSMRELVMGAASGRVPFMKSKIVEYVSRRASASCQIALVRRETQKGPQNTVLTANWIRCSSDSSQITDVQKGKKNIANPFTNLLLRKRSSASQRKLNSTGSSSTCSVEDPSYPSFRSCYEDVDVQQLEHSQLQPFLNSINDEHFVSAQSTMQWEGTEEPSPDGDVDVELTDAQAELIQQRKEIDMLKWRLDETVREAERLRSDLNRVLFESTKKTEQLLTEASLERKRREAAELTATQLLKWGKKWEEEAMENGAMLKLLNELYDEMKRKNEAMYIERDKAINEMERREMALHQLETEVNSTLTWLKDLLQDIRYSNPSTAEESGSNSSSFTG